MAATSPLPTVEAVGTRYAQLGGATTMMPTEDGGVVANLLTERFGMQRWSFALTATDANRWALRPARSITGRGRILVNSYSYHGSVDESFIVTSPDGPVARGGNVGPAYDVTETSRVVEYNDLAALERELAHGDVAAVLMEPALTNMGIVLPEPGYLEGVRALTRATGTLLINDETHTVSAGPGGAAHALEPGARHRDARQGDRRRHPDRRLRTERRARRPRSGTTRTPTSSTPAASAARSRETRCRWRPPAPPSSRC